MARSEREKSTTNICYYSAVTRPFRGRQRVASLCQLSLASPRLLDMRIRIGFHRSCGNLIIVQEVIIHTIYTSTLLVE
jgi:hypothetical protein